NEDRAWRLRISGERWRWGRGFPANRRRWRVVPLKRRFVRAELQRPAEAPAPTRAEAWLGATSANSLRRLSVTSFAQENKDKITGLAGPKRAGGPARSLRQGLRL